MSLTIEHNDVHSPDKCGCASCGHSHLQQVLHVLRRKAKRHRCFTNLPTRCTAGILTLGTKGKPERTLVVTPETQINQVINAGCTAQEWTASGRSPWPFTHPLQLARRQQLARKQSASTNAVYCNATRRMWTLKTPPDGRNRAAALPCR